MLSHSLIDRLALDQLGHSPDGPQGRQLIVDIVLCPVTAEIHQLDCASPDLAILAQHLPTADT